MALVLARLRFALQLEGLRLTGGTGLVVAAWLAAVIGGLVGAFCVAALTTEGGPVGELFSALMFVMIFASWVLTPLMAPVPTGDVIDPEVLEQYPLGRGERIAGLLLGGLLTPTAAATFLFAAGGAATLTADAAARVAAIVGALAFTVMCVAVSYGLRCLLAEALADRRGRDIAVAVSTLLVVGMVVLGQTVTPLLQTAEAAGATVVHVLSFTPPGAAGQLPVLVDAGDWLGAAARLGVVLLTIGAGVLVWAWALRRHVKGHTARQVRAHRSTTARALELMPAVLHRLPAGATLAAASQQLRYQFFRAPRAVQFIVLAPVLGIVFGITQLHTGGLALAAAVAAVGMSAGGLLNLFGYDGAGVEATVQTGASLERVLRGKALAVALYVVPAVAAVTAGFGIATGQPAQIPVALLTAYAATAVTFAVGAACSVVNPYDQETPRGDRAQLSLRTMGAFALTFGVVAGAGWIFAQTDAVVPLPVLAAVALVLGIAAAVVALRTGGRYLDRHPERLLAAFSPR